MQQATFAWDRPATRPCANGETGEDWTGQHHCRRCCADVDAAVEWMRLARLRGEYDEQGYTPLERKAQRRRKG